MNQQAIDILDEMIDEIEKIYINWCVKRIEKTENEYNKNRDEVGILYQAKSRIQALP